MISIKKSLNYSDFLSMFELEKQYYSVDNITPPEESYQWYINRQNSIIAVQDEKQMIGFMCLFPIPAHIKQEILQGTFNDANMTYEDIVELDHSNVSEVYALFLSCVVIHKEYRKTEALKLLLNEYKNLYLSLTKEGYKFDVVLSDNVTEEGFQFSKRLGLDYWCKTDHDSIIVKGHYETFLNNIR